MNIILSTFINTNEQSLNEPTTFPTLPTTVKLSCRNSDYLKIGSQTDHVKAKFLELPNITNSNFQYPFSVHNKQNEQEKRYLKKV